MSLTYNTLKAPIGMRRSYFAEIDSESANAHPTYDDPVSMGEGVKAEMSITTASAQIFGDDVDLLDVDEFVNAQVDAETACDDLTVNGAIFGHTVTSGEEVSNQDDVAPLGAYAFIQHLIKKDKSHVYRGVFFFKVSAMASSEKMSAGTKQSNLDPKMNPVSFKIQTDNKGDWRARKDFETQAAAEAWIFDKFGYSNT